MSGSGSLITTGFESSSVPPASPTEMPVPTDLPSPTEEGDVEYREVRYCGRQVGQVSIQYSFLMFVGIIGH